LRHRDAAYQRFHGPPSLPAGACPVVSAALSVELDRMLLAAPTACSDLEFWSWGRCSGSLTPRRALGWEVARLLRERPGGDWVLLLMFGAIDASDLASGLRTSIWDGLCYARSCAEWVRWQAAPEIAPLVASRGADFGPLGVASAAPSGRHGIADGPSRANRTFALPGESPRSLRAVEAEYASSSVPRRLASRLEELRRESSLLVEEVRATRKRESG